MPLEPFKSRVWFGAKASENIHLPLSIYLMVDSRMDCNHQDQMKHHLTNWSLGPQLDPVYNSSITHVINAYKRTEKGSANGELGLANPDIFATTTKWQTVQDLKNQ